MSAPYMSRQESLAEARLHANEHLEALKNVSRVAEFGGLMGMSEADALAAIRRLTRLYRDRDWTLEQIKQRVAAIQASTREAAKEEGR